MEEKKCCLSNRHSWLSLVFSFARRVAFCISRWLDNIRGWRLGGVRRALREFCNLISKFSHLFSKFGVDFKKFSHLLFQCIDSLITFSQLSFKFRDALDIELFFFRGQFSSLNHLLWLLSGERSPPLERKQIFSACITSL